MRASRVIPVAVAVVVVTAVGVRLLSTPRPVAVGVVAAEQGVVETLVANSEAGIVVARHEARLAAERAGRVSRVAGREGDRFAQGTSVVRLDDTSERARLHTARHESDAAAAALAAAEANARLADREHVRIAALHAQHLASDEALDEARARRDAARAERRRSSATLEAARANVLLLEDELVHLSVDMPFSGTLTSRLVEPGEAVVPGQAVAEVRMLDSLDVIAPLDERDAAEVEPGQHVRVTLDPFPGRVWHARVKRVAPVVVETRDRNRTLAVEAELVRFAGEPGGGPRPGMSADLEVVLAVRDSVLRVPTSAVIDGRRVLVVEDGRAVAREVSTGARNWDWTEVVSGLRAGERVIVTLDRAGVTAGARVRIERGASP